MFNTSKCLPSNMKIRMSLSKNNDEFVLLTDGDSKFIIFIEDCYLDISYYRPRNAILNLIETRIQKEPAPYFVARPEIIIKPVTNAGKMIRISDVFHDNYPHMLSFAYKDQKTLRELKKLIHIHLFHFKSFSFT